MNALQPNYKHFVLHDQFPLEIRNRFGKLSQFRYFPLNYIHMYVEILKKIY